MQVDFLIVGAGFSGCVMAERIASQLNKTVLLADKRAHIGGNAHDHYDAQGILVHRYGPHIFHTNSQEVIDYLGQFTSWRPYEHRVMAHVEGKNYPFPINRTTLNQLYGHQLQTEEEVQSFYDAVRHPIEWPQNAEEKVLSCVGQDLFEKFFKGYTQKQWGINPAHLSPSVTARIPVRTNTDDRYFTDTFQMMPQEGYTALFQKMICHPRITLALSTSFPKDLAQIDYDHLIYTGPIDEFFEQKFGPLPYRSIRFVHEHHPIEKFQEVGTVNYPSEDIPYTRITEFKHLTGQKCPTTSLCYEYPEKNDEEKYYPIPTKENEILYQRYATLAKKENVTFCGRLAEYKYYNMDHVVLRALKLFRNKFA